MFYIFGAEEYNWLLECEGVFKVELTDGMTCVVFDTVANANAAFNGIEFSTNYSVKENIVTLL